MFSLYLGKIVSGCRCLSLEIAGNLPLIVDGLDDEAQRRAHSIHVFPHDFLDDGRLSSVIQATVRT